MRADSSHDFIRVIAGPAYGLRRERVVGSEVQIQAVDGRLVRTAIPVPMDDEPGKTLHLWDRTGTQPVLAAGNAAQTSTCSGPPASPWWFTTRTMCANTPTTAVRYSTRPPEAAGRCSACDDFARMWPADLADGAR
jgi:hypothetical protein